MKIKNASDFQNAEKKYNLKKIPNNEIIIKSVDNFYDGPLSGECLWQNKNYYYECFDQIDPTTDSDTFPRKYLLLSLDDEQFLEDRRLKELFDKSADSETQRQQYFTEYQKSKSYLIQKNQIIGWFEEQINA